MTEQWIIVVAFSKNFTLDFWSVKFWSFRRWFFNRHQNNPHRSHSHSANHQTYAKKLEKSFNLSKFSYFQFNFKQNWWKNVAFLQSKHVILICLRLIELVIARTALVAWKHSRQPFRGSITHLVKIIHISKRKYHCQIDKFQLNFQFFRQKFDRFWCFVCKMFFNLSNALLKLSRLMLLLHRTLRLWNRWRSHFWKVWNLLKAVNWRHALLKSRGLMKLFRFLIFDQVRFLWLLRQEGAKIF